jgi:hypothetical protein
VVGFLIATLFWIGILGWQAAYAPTEMKKPCRDENEAFAVLVGAAVTTAPRF